MVELADPEGRIVKLSTKQQRFAGMFGLLLHYVSTLPRCSVTIQWAYRPPAAAALMKKKGKGITNSLHTKKLAVDLNLFINGVYQTSTKAHAPLGAFWKSIGGTWGGDFKPKPDGNHYSLEHGGVK